MPAATKRPIRTTGRPRNPPDPLIAARIRALREAARMTQAELAGKDFSKGFISLLETGRNGVSLRAARVLAARLGVSVDELLRPERLAGDRELELAMTRAEADLAAGRLDDALASAAPAAKSARNDVRARYARLKGRVLLAKDDAKNAVADLADAARLFRQERQRDLAARTLFDLAQAYARCEVPGEAVTYGLQCEQAINAGDLVDASLEMRLMAFLAGLFVTMGDLTSADLRIERARRLAEDIAEPNGAGNLYYHLAVLRQDEGDPESALRFALKALEAYEHLGVAAHIGSVWNTIGWIHVQRRQFDQANVALGRAAALAVGSGDDRLAAYVLQTRAELSLARGDATDALRLAQESIDQPSASLRCRATSLLVRAQALAASDATTGSVRQAFADAARAVEPFGRDLSVRVRRSEFTAMVDRGASRYAIAAASAALALPKQKESTTARPDRDASPTPASRNAGWTDSR
jgi:tetratricopeptide (TPR) repeat protein